jgi:hypothetical protein
VGQFHSYFFFIFILPIFVQNFSLKTRFVQNIYISDVSPKFEALICSYFFGIKCTKNVQMWANGKIYKSEILLIKLSINIEPRNFIQLLNFSRKFLKYSMLTMVMSWISCISNDSKNQTNSIF